MQHRVPSRALSDHLEGWDRSWERGSRRREYIYAHALTHTHTHTLMADSHYCMAETNTTLKSNHPPIKKFEKGVLTPPTIVTKNK